MADIKKPAADRPEMNNRRRQMAPPPQKPRKKHTVRNILIVLLLLFCLVVVIAFGINKWRIDFTLNGDDTVTYECGTPYRDEGASAEVTGSFLSFVHHPIEVEISTEGVNIHEPGTYYVRYYAEFLWLSIDEFRTVKIVDTTPPVIELTYIDDYYTLPKHRYKEEGFTATDNHDGDVTGQVRSEERDGVVYYTVTDLAGNTATAEREIFYDDRNAPVFHFPNGEEEFLYVGDTYKDIVTAEDDADGNVTSRIKASGKVNTKRIGTYTMTYTVSDEWGNVATKKRYVTVMRKLAMPKEMDPEKVIYLTFDDGPGQYTEELLGILKKHKVKATFFITLAYKDYQNLIRDEYRAGHTVAVHTATHEYSDIYESSEAYWEDFNEVQDVIQQQTKCRSQLFRFPGGSSNTISANYCEGIMTQLAQEAGEKGYIYVDWNVTSGDAGDTTDGNVMYENMMNGIHTYQNSVILCHDIKEYTVQMMDKFITDALAEGYTFLPLTAESPTCHHGINN